MLQAGRQAGTHWFSPWEHVLAEGVAGLVFVSRHCTTITT